MKNLFALTLLLAYSAPVFAYGPPGHMLVGDIAASRLDAPTAAKVHALIGDLTLGYVAKLPDDIKSWDPGARPYPESLAALEELDAPQYAALKAALRTYHDVNSHYTPDSPSERLHSQFHFTDVPIKDPEKYGDGPTGRRSTDVVQMIKYCAQVLHGDIPENNEYKITKPIAVILITHFVGDEHQPLHVGAEYFNAAGEKANPDVDKSGTDYPDEGGNTITVGTIAGITAGARAVRLHGIWDSQLVESAKKLIRAETGKASMTEKEYVKYYLEHPPVDWGLPADVPFTAWSEAWANQILPIAREAHERLKFTNLKPVEYKGSYTEHGTASELPGGDYYRWGGEVVKNEIGLAGYRLAALLEAALK